MNMVSLLGLGLVLSYNVMGINPAGQPTNGAVGLIIAFVAVLLILWAVWQSKRETAEMREAVGSIEAK
jgi:K(+)-stimulated pyrophosphate-energized sodium pump